MLPGEWDHCVMTMRLKSLGNEVGKFLRHQLKSQSPNAVNYREHWSEPGKSVITEMPLFKMKLGGFC